MKRLQVSAVVIGLLAAALISSLAYAQGFGHRGGHQGLLPPMVTHMVSRQQIRSAIAADKTNLRNLHSALKTARQQLEDDLIAGNSSKTATDLQALETAHNNMLAEKVKLAQTIVANLSPAQRAQVAQFVTQWRSMQEQQMQQRKQLFQQFSGAKGGTDNP